MPCGCERQRVAPVAPASDLCSGERERADRSRSALDKRSWCSADAAVPAWFHPRRSGMPEMMEDHSDEQQSGADDRKPPSGRSGRGDAAELRSRDAKHRPEPDVTRNTQEALGRKHQRGDSQQPPRSPVHFTVSARGLHETAPLQYHTRRDGESRSPTHCGPAGRGRATDRSSTTHPARAHRQSRCGKPRPP